MDTRGIIRPGALGRAFELDRRPPPADLADLIENHWIVIWDLRGRPAYRSEVMPHPAAHLVIEPDHALVYGVHRHRYVRTLTGAGWAVGTKFKPAGLARLIDRPVWSLTDRVVEAAELFGALPGRADPDAGPGGAPLARQAVTAALAGLSGEVASVDIKLGLVHDLLRAHRPAAEDPAAVLVQRVVTEMRDEPPGLAVADYAARHHVSTRTLQRLFRGYVGVGPKWVLQRYRLHEAIERLGGRPSNADMARFALELGYYDQPHFIRDFRALVGCTPSEYEAQARAVA